MENKGTNLQRTSYDIIIMLEFLDIELLYFFPFQSVLLLLQDHFPYSTMFSELCTMQFSSLSWF